jgi:methylglutaconyl-CoA hydratase
MPQFIRQTIARKVANITLARPDLHNAFNYDMMREIIDAFASLAASPEVRVIVLAAEGKSFCAGADINWMKRMVGYSFAENVADAIVLAKMLRTIRECPKPVIARVHGAAYGGGVGLVAACDMAVASANATFCLSEVKLGIVPAVISPFVLEKISASAARRYALTAERFDAAEARRIGLVSDVVEQPEQLDVWIEKVVKHLVANGPGAISACKQILSHVAGQQWDDLQSYTTQQIARIRVSPEGQEGLRAFLEKRKPSWAG